METNKNFALKPFFPNIQWTVETRIVLVVFAIIFIFLFWRIESYPSYFNDIVEHMIHLQVNHVFDHEDISEKVTWYWASLHSHDAVSSPVYGFIIEWGLRLFGLTLFGVRFFPALLEFLALIITYLALRKYFSQYLVMCFIILLSLSPWHLLIARSGGFHGFSLSLFLIALSMVIMLPGKGRSVVFAVSAGTSVGFLAYAYDIFRISLFLLIILGIVSYCKTDKYNFFTFMGMILAIFSVQISNWKKALTSFFSAGGEGLYSVALRRDGTFDIALIMQKLKENFDYTYRLLFGLNNPKELFNVNLVCNFWDWDIVLYPKFLVPFFGLGVVFCFVHLFVKRKLPLIWPFIFLIAGVMPGMLSGVGAPNLFRSTLLVAPIYFFIAYGLYFSFAYLGNLLKRSKTPFIVPGIFVFCIILISVYQVNNYFNFPKDADQQSFGQTVLYRQFLSDYIATHPKARILMYDACVFDVCSYTVVRWLGGEHLQKMIEDGRFKFLREDNRDYIGKLIREGYFTIAVTVTPRQFENVFPDFTDIVSQTSEQYKVYYLKGLR